MMADNPLPITNSVDQKAIPVSDSPQGSHRDDNPQAWSQHYHHVTELHFHYTLPNPYGGSPIERRSHGYLAVPSNPPPGEKYRAVLALNGHHGSAWQMIKPDAGTIYWYGNAFARRGYVVLALDISHRPKKTVSHCMTTVRTIQALETVRIERSRRTGSIPTGPRMANESGMRCVRSIT